MFIKLPAPHNCMHVLYSSKIEASRGPAERLRGMGFGEKGEWKGHMLVDTGAGHILDVPTDFETDWLLVLSTHKSERGGPSFTVHIPGNWDSADMGGEARTLNTAYASRMKDMLISMNENNSLGWNVNQEVDHHGPTCKLPIIFIEIGSGPAEWGNPKAHEIIAEAVMDSIDKKELYPSWFGAGGGHYAPYFTKKALEGEDAFGHILPKYKAATVGMDTVEQAVEKNVEKIEGLWYEKKSFRAEDRDKLFGLVRELGIEIRQR